MPVTLLADRRERPCGAELGSSSCSAQGGRVWLRHGGLACLSGLLLLLSFPAYELDFLVWVGFVPLLLALDGRTLFQAFLLSSVTAWVLFTGVFYWIWTVPAFNILDYFLLATYLSLYGGVFGLGVGWMHGRAGMPLALVAPPLWVTLEYLRAHASFLGVPWMLLGHSQYRQPSLIQLCSVTGVYGLSFLIVLVNAALTETAGAFRAQSASVPSRRLIVAQPPASVLIALSGVGLAGLLGTWSLPASDAENLDSFPVALVQGNIPQDRKWDQAYRAIALTRHELLTLEAGRHHPALIVWPETAVPGDVEHAPALLERVGRVARETNSHLLVGSASAAKFSDKSLSGKNYNSMVLISANGQLAGEYRKMVLVPFGEYAPLRSLIRWSAAIATPRRDIVPGDQFTLFKIGRITFGATICWESLFPDLFRQFVNQGAQFMVNAGNEAWFGETAAPSQFFAMTVFRAVENHVAIARAENTGISAFIGPDGRILGRIERGGKNLFVEGFLTQDVPLRSDLTFYTRYGDLFVWIVMGIALMMVPCALLRARTRHAVAGPVPAAPIPSGKEDHAVPQPVQYSAECEPLLPDSGRHP